MMKKDALTAWFCDGRAPRTVPVLMEEEVCPLPPEMHLEWQKGALTLVDTSRRPPMAVSVDFCHGRMGFRQQRGRLQGELLARAIGREPARVWDTTVGLGRDAFLMAALGHSVTAVERVTVTALLLLDGLIRASASPGAVETVSRLTLYRGDAHAFFAECSPDAAPDVIYCDPIYPERRKRAAVKKEMQVMRRLAGADADAERLIASAMQTARQRVVVKRPPEAPPAWPNPSHVISSKSVRYDVYVSPTG